MSGRIFFRAKGDSWFTVHNRQHGTCDDSFDNETLSFNELKRLLETTDGNLSVHARKLEEAGYIDCTKSFEGRVPKTEYRLNAAGRQALERYLEHMEALIRRTRER